MSGNLARRRMTKFMPADFKLIETRQPPLKDMYDEWLARIICYAFRARGQRGRSHPAGRQGFRGREQNTNIFLTAYSRSPIAQTFMIWSFDWGSAWSRSPFASTELSTLVFRDHVLWRSRNSILFRPKGTGRAAPRRGIQTIDTRRWSSAQRREFDHLCRPTVSASSRQEQRKRHATRSFRARESPIGNLLPKSETKWRLPLLDANDNRLWRMSLSLFCGPKISTPLRPISKRNSFPPRETWAE
jgi:hypothetical protein